MGATQKFKRGLTLGKFAPLHRGHQLVIETALAEMDDVVVLVNDAPETTNVPLAVRANWIRAIYPTAKVIECPDGPTQVGYTATIMRRQEDYILRTLDGVAVSHFYSSEPYGEHVSRALHALDRSVDPARAAHPISATEIRDYPYAHREHLHRLVYRDLITEVVFVGAPCTGKTTIARRLAAELDSVWMPEYGREYWETHQVDRRLSLEQLSVLASTHLARQEALIPEANRYLFSDTNAITTYVFSTYYHDNVAPALAAISEEAHDRYDLVFLCDTDIPYENTPDSSGDANRMYLQEQTRLELERREIAYRLLSGDLAERVRVVKSVLERHQKWDPA